MTKIVLLFLLGLVLICLGGDKLVDSAVIIAKKLKIPEIVVGATIVSIGTTLPEVLVSTSAAFQGSADIAAGNALGSIICNTALIAGLAQLLAPTKKIKKSAISWRLGVFFGSMLFIILVGGLTGGLRRWAGFLLLITFAVYAYANVKFPGDKEEEEDNSDENLIRHLIILAACAAMLYFGANLLVDNGILLAQALGVSERVIAVTFIALGTSLPELVTSISSIIKGYGDVGLGNIIGANIMNLVLVLGIPAAVSGIQFSQSAISVDAVVGTAAMALLTIPILIRKKGSRLQGVLLLAIYVVYVLTSFL